MKKVIVSCGLIFSLLTVSYVYGQEACIIRAQKLLKAQKCRKAISVLQRCANKNTAIRNSYVFFLELGNAYFLCKNTEKALENYRKGFNLNRKNLALCEGVARTSFELKHYIDAARCYENCSRLRVKNKAEYLFMSAYSYYLGGNFRDALKLMENITGEANRKVPMDWLKLQLNAAVAAESWNKAEEAALSLINMDPKNSLYWKELAVAEKNQNKLLNAAVALDVFLVLNKQDIETQRLLVGYYMNAGVYRRALELCREIRKNGKEECDFDKLVNLYIASGDINGALSVINNEAGGKSNIIGPLLRDKGKLLVQTGYYDEGISLLERYLSDYGESVDALFWLGIASIYKGDFQKATDTLSKVENICFHSEKMDSQECKSVKTILSSLNQIDLSR